METRKVDYKFLLKVLNRSDETHLRNQFLEKRVEKLEKAVAGVQRVLLEINRPIPITQLKEFVDQITNIKINKI